MMVRHFCCCMSADDRKDTIIQIIGDYDHFSISHADLIEKIVKRGITSKSTAGRYLLQLVQSGKLISFDRPKRYCLPYMDVAKLQEGFNSQIKEIEEKLQLTKNEFKNYHPNVKENICTSVLDSINRNLDMIKAHESSTKESVSISYYYDDISDSISSVGELFHEIKSLSQYDFLRNLDYVDNLLRNVIKRRFELLKVTRKTGAAQKRIKITEQIDLLDEEYDKTIYSLEKIKTVLKSLSDVKMNVSEMDRFSGNFYALVQILKEIKKYTQRFNDTLGETMRHQKQTLNIPTKCFTPKSIKQVNKHLDTAVSNAVQAEQLLTKMCVGEIYYNELYQVQLNIEEIKNNLKNVLRDTIYKK